MVRSIGAALSTEGIFGPPLVPRAIEGNILLLSQFLPGSAPRLSFKLIHHPAERIALILLRPRLIPWSPLRIALEFRDGLGTAAIPGHWSVLGILRFVAQCVSQCRTANIFGWSGVVRPP